MKSGSLVLSLFPGIGLLDMAFEEEGFCVVRGPDLLWGGDVHRFHPPAGKFAGVIGGDPCPAHSHLGVVSAGAGCDVAPDLSREFGRCVWEAQPVWWLRENVPGAPPLTVAGYLTWRGELDNREDCGGIQRRRRVFDFGTRIGAQLPLEWWRPAVPRDVIPTVTANATIWKDGRAFGDKSERYYREVMLPAQGLPPDFLGRRAVHGVRKDPDGRQRRPDDDGPRDCSSSEERARLQRSARGDLMTTRARLRIVNKGRSKKQRAVTRRFAEKSYAIGQIPRDGGQPAASWWIGTSREAFVQRLAGEAARMQTSRFGRVSDPTLSGE